MSYVEVFKVCQNGDVRHFSDRASNALAFGPIILKHLILKYDLVGAKAREMACIFKEPLEKSYCAIFDDEGTKSLWSQFERNHLSRAEKLVLALTFDKSWFSREILPELIGALEEFFNEHIAPDPEEPRYDQRPWIGLAWVFNALLSDPDCRGVAINSTSVVQPHWNIYVDGLYHPRNVDTDGDCFEVGEELETLSR